MKLIKKGKYLINVIIKFPIPIKTGWELQPKPAHPGRWYERRIEIYVSCNDDDDKWRSLKTRGKKTLTNNAHKYWTQ